MQKWKTRHSEYLYETPFGNLRKEACELPDGQLIAPVYINEFEDWVNAVVLTKDQELVLVEQYRHGGGEFYLEVPAGKLEAGETGEVGILREVLEETGYTSLAPPVLLGDFMVNPAVQTNKIKTYLLVDAFKAQDPVLDATEELKTVLFGFAGFGSQLQSGEVKTQLFTAAAYYMAKDYLQEN